MHAGNNSSIDISHLHVFTRNIKGRQTRRAGESMVMLVPCFASNKFPVNFQDGLKPTLRFKKWLMRLLRIAGTRPTVALAGLSSESLACKSL